MFYLFFPYCNSQCDHILILFLAFLLSEIMLGSVARSEKKFRNGLPADMSNLLV
jgi:hypothetical protein